MFRMIHAIINPFVEIFCLTVVEPIAHLVSVFREAKKPLNGARYRHPAPSVLRTIRRQQIMVSPKVDFVPLLPEHMSVTAHYVRLNTARPEAREDHRYIH